VYCSLQASAAQCTVLCCAVLVLVLFWNRYSGSNFCCILFAALIS
jgi:hypothetical protein